MTKKLISKTSLATLAGVNPSVITRLCQDTLAPALVGKRVDQDHPLIQSYLAKKERDALPSPAQGIDPLYEQAIEHCRRIGRVSANALKGHLKVGVARATDIAEMIRVTKVLDKPVTDMGITITPVAPPPPPPPAKTGTAARKATKKNTATDEDMIIEVPENIEAFADMTLREIISKFGTDERFVDWLKAGKGIEDINEKRLKNAETKGLLVSRKLIKVGVIEPINIAHIKLLSDGAKTIATRTVAMVKAGRTVEDVEKFIIDQMTSFIKPVKSKIARTLRDA